MRLRWKSLREGAMLHAPKRPGDAGMDLEYMPDDVPVGYTILRPRSTRVLKTGIAVEIPAGHMGEVRPRSGFSAGGLLTHVGTIDAGYRGEIGVIVTNVSDHEYDIKVGYRIAQLVVVPIVQCEPEQVEELTETERGADGFGSSGR